MKIVAAVLADFQEANPGGPSRLTEPLVGTPILVRTLQRVARIEGPAARCLCVQPRDEAVATSAVHAAGLADVFDVRPLDTGLRPRRELIRAARKWNLNSWRGGLLGLSWFDEFADPPTLARIVQHYRCDAVLGVDGHQPLLDPALASAMCAHHVEHAQLAKFTFSAAPPGLAGVLIGEALLVDLLEGDWPVGLVLSYRPELAHSDPLTLPACCHVAPEIAQTAARFAADTRTARELVAAALAAVGENVDAERLCAWLREGGYDPWERLPQEVELELTTADPLPETTLRPRGDRVPRRELSDLEAVARLGAELGVWDDRLVCLGGHGDPLCHPHFADVCRLLRAGGVYGLAVTTTLVDLPEPAFEALFAAPIDVVEVRLDATAPASYLRVHGRDAFNDVMCNLTRIEERRRSTSSPRPVLVCSFTRHSATLPELEEFHDAFIMRHGSALIRGYNEYAGRMPPDTLLRTEPPVREPCRRLGRRLMLLADGTAVLCEQDVCGEVPIGNWTREPLTAIWGGAALRQARAAHAAGNLQALSMCGRCQEWHRP